MTDKTQSLISAKGLSIRYAGQQVLEHIDASVHEGEIVTVIGPNGSGKTTLVKAVLGLIEPDEGDVERRAGLTVGYMPQKISIDPVLPLSVSRLMTLTHSAPSERIGAALAETGVEHLAGKSVHGLSGGEFQRVMLARCLLRDPDLLVLDEPVQGVDFRGEAELYELIGRIRDTHRCGVLMVSHDLHLVMASTDRVLCLNRHICCEGEPEAVSRHPEYRRLFGGGAADAFAVYRHHHDHSHGIDGEVASATGEDCGHDHHDHA